MASLEADPAIRNADRDPRRLPAQSRSPRSMKRDADWIVVSADTFDRMLFTGAGTEALDGVVITVPIPIAFLCLAHEKNVPIFGKKATVQGVRPRW